MPIEEEWLFKPDKSKPDSRFDYTCAYCGRLVNGRVTALYSPQRNLYAAKIVYLLCPSCDRGSVWYHDNTIIPGALPGSNLEELPKSVDEVYQEARKCFSVGAYTACELMCRKLLMNIAIEKEAPEGQSFAKYIDYLKEKHYITPNMKDWADLIRTHGNEATHEIVTSNKERALDTFLFTMNLLTIIYVMVHKKTKYEKPSKTT